MKNAVNFLKNAALAIGLLCVLSAAAAAQAQYSSVGNGTGTFNGRVERSVDIRTDAATSGGGTLLNGVTRSTNGDNNALNTTLNFGDVSPNNSQVTTNAPFLVGTMRMWLRSNAPYILRISRAGNLQSGAANSGTLRAGDVGIGMATAGYNNRGNGNLVMANALNDARNGTPTSLRVSNNFGLSNSDPNITLSNGRASYTASLNSVPTAGNPLVLVSGSRISRGGDNSSSNNAISVAMRVVIKPQYYTTGTSGALPFSESLTFSIVPAP